jgi:DNA-binding CsgD family transcriptional regulator
MSDEPDADREAIMRVIAEETEAYFRKDFEGWARCWVHGSHVRRWGWYPQCGIWLVEGWDAVRAEMWDGMARFPAPNASGAAVRRERVSVTLAADMAWVTFDQYAPRTGDAFDVAGLQHNMRVMQKLDGVWKIACVGVLKPWLDAADHPVIRVDEHGTVLWMNALATGQLGDHGLTVSSGRLRARDAAGDKRLQASIRSAAGAIGYLKGQAAGWTTPSARGGLPVVLGEDDGPPPRVCWVAADGGMILVTFDDGRRAEQRLAAAAVVYGLTPAQARLAARVVAGEDLTDAAAALGIRASTARTHLKALFEKTGVRRQAALVRVLLSAEAPVA